MSARVVHGANEGFFSLDGQTVGAVRKALREVFNIPDQATALICGEPSADERVLSATDTLEFIQEDGQKGLGELLTPKELRDRWQISEDDYEELLVLGLPSLTLASGIRHPEAALDEFWRQLGDRNRPSPPQIVGSQYVASRLNCTAVWVADMARRKEIPPSCVVTGTGNGRPWKFHRIRIDEWLSRR